MLWGLLSFKQHLLLGHSKPPGRRSQAGSVSSGFGGGHARANPRKEEMRLEVLRRGLEVDMPEQTPGKKKWGWKCFVAAWRWACRSKPPTRKKSGWKCFVEVWGWTCQSKPPGRRNEAGSVSSGFGGGHARANPREEEIRLEVFRRVLEVDMPEQTPGKKKSGWKCFVGVWRWTCQSKPPGRRNQAESASSGFGGGHARAKPREEEIRLEVLRRGLEVDMPQQTAGGFIFVAYQQANSVTPWSVGSQHKMKQMKGLEHDCSVCVLKRFVSVVDFQAPNKCLFLRVLMPPSISGMLWLV